MPLVADDWSEQGLAHGDYSLTGLQVGFNHRVVNLRLLVELVKRLKRVLPDDVGIVFRIGVYSWPVAVLCVNRDFEVVDERNHVVDSRVATLIILRWIKHGVEDSPLSSFIGPSDMHIVITVNANVGVPSPMCTGVRDLGLEN